MAKCLSCFVRQAKQLGTGHAVQQALPLLDDDGVVVVLSGDVPLTQVDTLQALIQVCDGKNLALLTIDFADPTGYGRIVRDGDVVQAIVEHKDASPAQRQIDVFVVQEEPFVEPAEIVQEDAAKGDRSTTG